MELLDPRFPRSNRYHPAWVIARGSGGANALWLTEWLSESLDLRAGMRVLDLGCGRAMSSIFLHREFNVEVWAADLWFSAADNLQCVREAGISAGVYPVRSRAGALKLCSTRRSLRYRCRTRAIRCCAAAPDLWRATPGSAAASYARRACI